MAGAKGRKCETAYCRGTPRKYRRKCEKCRKREYARRHPFRYHYNALRGNARRRGKNFDLTFDEFKALWLEHPEKWAVKKRPGVECPWQMDRIDNTKGYTAGNIQIIEKRKNILKYHRHDRHQIEVYWAKKNGQTSLDLLSEEAPF